LHTETNQSNEIKNQSFIIVSTDYSHGGESSVLVYAVVDFNAPMAFVLDSGLLPLRSQTIKHSTTIDMTVKKMMMAAVR
jgi:hypothetical protein